MKKSHAPTRQRLLAAFLLAGSCVAPVSLSTADSIKISKLWAPDVTIEKVADGNITFTTKSGEETERPLTAVEGIKLDAFPDLAKAYAAIEARKPAEAIPLFQKVASTASKPWIKQFCKAQLIALYDQSKMPIESANMVLELAKETSEKAYFANPPEKSLAGLDAKSKRDLRDRLVQAQSTLKGAPAEAVKAILESLGPIEAAPAVAAATPGASPGASPAATPGAVAAAPTAAPTAAGPSAVPLPSEMDPKDPVAVMLRKGDFEGAIKATEEILSKSTPEMSLRLYQNGVAKLYLGLATKDAAAQKRQIMDAGLALARCYFYFPRSAWSGAAMIELGYVHQLIGQPDIAKSLFAKAINKIDTDKDLDIKAHYDQLTGETAPTESSQ